MDEVVGMAIWLLGGAIALTIWCVGHSRDGNGPLTTGDIISGILISFAMSWLAVLVWPFCIWADQRERDK